MKVNIKGVLKMKKSVFIWLLICVTMGMAFSGDLHWVSKNTIIFYNSVCIVGWERLGGPPPNSSTASTTGAIYDSKGNRRHPKKLGTGFMELIDNRACNQPFIPIIDTGNYDKIYILVSNDIYTFFGPKAQSRLFIVEPGRKLSFRASGNNFSFNFDNAIKEDQDFYQATNFQETMDMYARSVPADFMRKRINDSRKNAKTDDELADKIITSYAALAGGWGGLTGAAHAILIPASSGMNVVTNMMKAQLAFALSVVYRNESTGDDLRDDLMIFFNGDDVEMTIEFLLKEAGKGAAVDLAQNLTKAGLKKAAVKAFQSKGLKNSVTSKLTMKGVESDIPVLGIVLGTYSNVDEVIKFGAQAKRYYSGRR